MFGLSFGEIAIIFILALVLLGPQKLPELARALGKGLREIRRASDDIKETIEAESLRAETRDLERRILAPDPPIPPAPVQPPAPKKPDEEPK